MWHLSRLSFVSPLHGRRASRPSPEFFSVLLLLLGLSLLLAGCAAKQLTPASELDSAPNHTQQGIRELERGNLTQAKLEFERAAALDRKYAEAHSGLALVYAELGLFDKAEKEVARALKLNGRSVDAYAAKGRVITKRKAGEGWLKNAVAAYQKGLKHAPDSGKLYYFMGQSYQEALKFESAADAYRKVVELNGLYLAEANLAWETVQKIERAAPGTEIGARIALVPRLTRAELAVLLVEEMKIADYLGRGKSALPDPSFQPPQGRMIEQQAAETRQPADIDGHWARNWIRDALTYNVFEIYPDLHFYPDEFVTRAEYALVVQSVLGQFTKDPSIAGKYFGEPSRFPDMNANAPAYSAAALCVDRGILKAETASGAFTPQGTISGADALLAIREMQNIFRTRF